MGFERGLRSRRKLNLHPWKQQKRDIKLKTNVIACMDLELAANSTCTSTQPAHVQVEFAAKSKTVHAIMFINQIRSCMNHICAKECEADVKKLRNRCHGECEADVRMNAKPMS